MGKARLDPLNSVKFHCRACGSRFQNDEPAVIADDSTPWHPWRYECDCPACGAQAEQIWWQRNLLKSWSEATGPTTPEGKRRCRFNAITHGLTAEVATYYPAKPGKYSHCTGCQYLEEEDCVDFGGCLRRTEILMRYLMAYEANDPRMLQHMHAKRQAHIDALAQEMLLAIIQDGGPRQKTPEWYSDKDGGFHLAGYDDPKSEQWIQLYKLEEHPLLKRLFDLMSKNKMTLEDQGMTPKVQEDQDILKGELADEIDSRETLSDYGRRQAEALEKLSEQIDAARREAARDPVLIEHQAIEGDAEVVNE